MHAQIPHAVFSRVFHGDPVDVAADGVGVFVIVAVAGGGAQQGAHVVIALKIGVECFEELVHAQFLFLKDQLFDCRQGIHNGAQAHVFKVSQIDALGDLLLMQVHAVLHAQIMHGRAHGLGKMPGAQLVDDILLGKGRLQKEHVLLHIGVPEFLPGLE